MILNIIFKNQYRSIILSIIDTRCCVL